MLNIIDRPLFTSSDFRDMFLEEYPAYRGEHQYEEIAFELEKLLTLPCQGAGPVLVTSRAVDRLWRTFMYHVIPYRNFCTEMYDHHQLRRVDGGSKELITEAANNFWELYVYTYGIPSSLWFQETSRDTFDQLLIGTMPNVELVWFPIASFKE